MHPLPLTKRPRHSPHAPPHTLTPCIPHPPTPQGLGLHSPLTPFTHPTHPMHPTHTHSSPSDGGIGGPEQSGINWWDGGIGGVVEHSDGGIGGPEQSCSHSAIHMYMSATLLPTPLSTCMSASLLPMPLSTCCQLHATPLT